MELFAHARENTAKNIVDVAAIVDTAALAEASADLVEVTAGG